MFIGTSYSTITPEEQKGFIAYLEKEEKALRDAIARDEKKKSDSNARKKATNSRSKLCNRSR